MKPVLASVELNEDQFCHEITKMCKIGNTPVKRQGYSQRMRSKGTNREPKGNYQKMMMYPGIA